MEFISYWVKLALVINTESSLSNWSVDESGDVIMIHVQMLSPLLVSRMGLEFKKQKLMITLRLLGLFNSKVDYLSFFCNS